VINSEHHMSNDEVVDNQTAHRFEIRRPEGVAVLQYRYDASGRLVLVHTEVPPALRRQGIATRLVRGVLELARDHHLEVTPVCPFVVAFLATHPEFRSVVHERDAAQGGFG
jgi:predicted GNAT family acetyltransferase